jgi:serine/threonine-protein kinase
MPETSPHIEERFLKWLKLREQRIAVTPDELCRDCPQLLPELKKRIEAFDAGESIPHCPTTEAVPPGGARQGGPADLTETSFTFPEPVSPERRYLPLRFHAKGGLGEVFVAEDAQLHRQVALKRIQKSRAGDWDSRCRFIVEAEITGRLEHPGIVPVYGLEEDEAGQPCYAMRFIQGVTLDEAIRRFHKEQHPTGSGARTLAFQQLVIRLIAVCNTVAYAHSRGILHRDLKPANIMLGKYGETLVVDWGLAKPFTRQDAVNIADKEILTTIAGTTAASTASGTTLGTPAFMSPEQASGRSQALGPASDIYSLGATLYVLLTGQAPFAGTLARDLLEQVQQGKFPPPRQISKRVEPALEAICIKAMAQRPEQRYATALELAADLEHWLADEPVSARPESPGLKLARWRRRHRTVVTAVAAAAGVALVGLAVATGLLLAANQRESQAKNLAQRREEEARANLELARQAVDEYLTRVSDDARLRESFRPLRKQLLQTAIPFFEKFVAQGGDDPAAEVDLGKAYFRLGWITNEIDDPKIAINRYEQARALFSRLAEENPDNALYLVNLADSQNAVGGLYEKTGRPTDAEKAFLEELALRQRLASKDPDSQTFQSTLAWSHDTLGRFYNRIGKQDQAERALEEALRICRPLATAHPQEVLYRQQLASIFHSLGTVYRSTARLTQAESVYRQRLQIHQELAAEHSAEPRFLSALASCYHTLGLLYWAMLKDAEEEKALETARALYQSLADQYPEVTEYQGELAASQRALGQVRAKVGKTEQAAADFQAALAIHRRLTNRYPEVFKYGCDLGTLYCALTEFANRKGKPDEALDWSKQAIETAEALLQKSPRDVRTRVLLCESCEHRAEALTKLGRYAEAVQNLDRALTFYRGHAHPEFRLDRAVALARAGDHGRATAEAIDLARDTSLAAKVLFRLASVFSLSAAAARQDVKLTRSDRNRLGDEFAGRAMDLLARMRTAADFKPANFLKDLRLDKDFEPVRVRADFQKLLREVEMQARTGAS